MKKNNFKELVVFIKKNQQAKHQSFRPGSLTPTFKKLGNPVKGVKKPVSSMVFENHQSRVRTGSFDFVTTAGEGYYT